MAKNKNYEVTFAKGTPQQATYPVEAESKEKAKETFSHQYLGRWDQALMRLLKVVQVQSDEDE